jgi:hypothetical protein
MSPHRKARYEEEIRAEIAALSMRGTVEFSLPWGYNRTDVRCDPSGGIVGGEAA